MRRMARWWVVRGGLILGLAMLCALMPGCVTETSRQTAGAAPAEATPDPKEPESPSPGTLLALARILATQGRDADCERTLRQILKSDPGYLPAYSDLAELQMRQNHLDEAMESLTAGLSKAPADPVLLNNLGMCHALKEDYAGALDAFSRASEVAPDNKTYLANKAMALGMLERYDESAAIYRKVLDSPEDVIHNMAVLRKAKKPNGAAAPAGK